MKKVLIRSDASDRTGAGHVMRSVAIAQCIERNRGEVVFLTATRDERIRQYLKNQRFETVFLDLPLDDCGTAKDLEIILPLLNAGYDWMVLDNDYFDHDFQRAIRLSGTRLLVLDDRNERRFDVDLLVNHALDAEKLGYRSPISGRLLLGSSYALIRQEFLSVAPKREKGMSRLLVTLGGSVQQEIGAKIIRAVRSLNGRLFEIRWVGGFSEKPPKTLPENLPCVEWIPATLDIAPHYDWADLVVCAGGGTCWELCFMGLVGLVGALAPHQLPVADALSMHGIFTSLGSYANVTESVLAEGLAKVLDDPAGLEAKRVKARSFVDGKGTQRIVDVMKELTREKL